MHPSPLCHPLAGGSTEQQGTRPTCHEPPGCCRMEPAMSGNALDARAKLHHITDTRETVDPVHECVLVMLPKSILCQSP